MLYLLAVVLPPLAVLLVGKPIQALLNLVLWPLGVVPAIIHAVLLVNDRNQDRRNKDLIRAIRSRGRGVGGPPVIRDDTNPFANLD